MVKTPEEIKSILAVDCGSTTTKAILIELDGRNYRLKVRGEAPTTVEKPFEDVTKGVRNAVREVEELAGKTIMDEVGIITPAQGDKGVDLFLATSSAGGGLQMMVAGVVKKMSAESAQRAALGAGAIVMDTIAVDDGRLLYQKIERIRQLRPDMVLVAGGIDGGTKSHVVEIAEILSAADPKPRLGSGYNLPIIYCGNKEARKEVGGLLEGKVDLRYVDNIRPVLEKEVLGPAREEIHNLFMEHVMAQAPGYKTLKSWTDAPIMPTPGAVGKIIQTVAEENDINVIGVDIGGATTDVFSMFENTFNRTVSANLGMSYSVCNVLVETGIDNIMRWIPFDMDPNEIKNRIRNKMIRPTTIPHTLEDLIVEQAIAREALSLAFAHHKTLAVGLRGVQRQRNISDAFDQSSGEDTIIDMMDLDMIIGSGGALSHAPRRLQSGIMMIDAFQPEGITRLAVDSIFMMPQLGVLSSVHPKAATEVFEKDCLIHLGTCITPTGNIKKGAAALKVKYLKDGKEHEETIYGGEIRVIPCEDSMEMDIIPASGLDIGNGKGKHTKKEVSGGVCGIFLDCRGRPLSISTDPKERAKQLLTWFSQTNMYPIVSVGLEEGRGK
ncbi:glutamate mutase L [Alkalicella caledoniensis]|uniref:Glutamate mutase L n=1 Tax=Alkalicella caledoniensis TaxID=2731377 RepID=A0A7G9W788_ALKCA|nr:glutamate mutase L [Alkalicella caledoniensis]QNO14550.1 glutamate mutase L [Alkalicella caledoniensis]